jgi:hypothetical protein
MINIKCIGATVSDWDNENGASLESFDKGGFDLGQTVSLKDAIADACNVVGYDAENITIDDFNDCYLDLAVIENSDGQPDKNGCYLVTYAFEFSVCRVVNDDEIEGALNA